MPMGALDLSQGTARFATIPRQSWSAGRDIHAPWIQDPGSNSSGGRDPGEEIHVSIFTAVSLCRAF